MDKRLISKIAGISYLGIFVAAIYANFFVLEAIIQDPITTINQQGLSTRIGILAFLIAAVLDVIIAWALYELYRSHPLTQLSTYFRLLHAVIMGVAVFALPFVFIVNSADQILLQVEIFNTIWLIGLFFFGIHLILLGRIVKQIRIIPYFLILAGLMYILDTSAHFLMPNYSAYKNVFLAFVAIPSIVGEMAFTIWLLRYSGKTFTS